MEYKCTDCEATDCKLWRGVHFADEKLTCWECLEKKGHTIRLHDKHRHSDQVYNSEIGPENYLPAVPDLNGQFWGYTSVPSWWVAWWKALPDKGSDCTLCHGSGKLGEFQCIFCKGSGARVTKATHPEA